MWNFFGSENGARRATTLIEVLIAVSILSFAVAPLFALFTFSTRGTKKSTYKVQALFLAQKVMEEMRAQLQTSPGAIHEFAPFREWSVTRQPPTFWVSNDTLFFDDVYGPGRPITRGSPLFKAFDRFRIRTDVAAGAIRNLWDVAVTVRWREGKKDLEVELRTAMETCPHEFTR